MQGDQEVYSCDSEEENEREKGDKDALGKRARCRFEAMLRSITSTREKIARCMAFAIEHAEAAEDVSHYQILVDQADSCLGV